MRSRSNGGVIGAYQLPSQNFANGVFFIHDAAIYNTGSNPIWPLGTGYIYSASGGTITIADDNTNYKLHKFKANGTFTITTGSGYIDILVVGGGGAGGYAAHTTGFASQNRGGGGAGGQVTLFKDVFVNGPTTFTVTVGEGGTSLTTSNFTTPAVGAGKLSRVTSSSGYSFVSYGGGPGGSMSNSSTKYELNSITVSGGGSPTGCTTTLVANTLYSPLYTRSSFGTGDTGTTFNYTAPSGGDSWKMDAAHLNAGGGAGATANGRSGNEAIATNSSRGGNGFLWTRANTYYGAGGGGGTTYSFIVSYIYGSFCGLSGPASTANQTGTLNASGGWSYSSSTVSTYLNGQPDTVTNDGYGRGGGGGASTGTTTSQDGNGGYGDCGTVIFCYRYK